MTPLPPVSRRSFLGLLGAGAGAAVLGVAGCGNGDSPGASEIDVWVLQDSVQNKIQQGALDRFNRNSKARAKLSTFQNSAYTQKLRVAMGSPNQPDIFFNWGGGSIRQYVQNDLLVDLTPVLSEDASFKAKFLPAVLDAGKIGDRYYGIPLRGMQPVILYYNKHVFEKVGVRPPTSWQDILALVDRFKAVGITPFALAGGQSWTELMWLEYLTNRYGGPAVFEAIAAGEKGAWRHPAITWAINAIRDLMERGAFGTNFSSVGYEAGGASTIFAQGRAAMHLMGSWEYTNQLDQQPKFAAEGLGWTTFPAVEGGQGDPKAIVGNPTNYFSITKNSDHVGACIDLLRQEMASDKYVSDLIAAGDVPAVADIEARLQDSPNPEFAGFVYRMVRDASSFQLSWDQAIENKYAQPMLDNLQRVFLGELDAEGYVTAMENVR